MNRYDWLKSRDLADPDAAVVMHIASDFRVMLCERLGLTPRAVCGASLAAEDDSADPTEDSPVCADCVNHRRLLTGLQTAYLNLWYRQSFAALATLIALRCASIVGLLVADWFHSVLMWPAALALIGSVLLITFAPGDDESDGA